MADEFFSRIEHLAEVDSTQRVMREWLAEGLAEVAVVSADVQTAGRGRQGRNWHAPPGAALLLSIGFRPTALAVGHAWRLGATVSLAMLDAAEAAAGLKDDTLWLKWPNDIVATPGAAAGQLMAVGRGPQPLKVAGVLGEVELKDGLIETAVVGIGVNADWRAIHFPAELALSMTSLHELSAGRPIDREQLLDEFLARLEPRYEGLRTGRFDVGGWSRKQVTTGRQVELDVGSRSISGLAVGVEPESGALLVEVDGKPERIESGEVVRCRLR